MSATLYPGIRSLHLSLSTPVDTVTGKVRNDLSAVRVWYSSTSGFDPLTQGTQVFNGLGLDVTIPNLQANQTYYVKYAFISAIDPDTFTVSGELSQTVLDENARVYGYLTRDPIPIQTKSDGTGGDFSGATGTFKVFNYSQDVTGTGVVYGVIAGSADSLVANINSSTGIYAVTDLTDDTGNITFYAQYDGLQIEQTLNVYRARAGDATSLSIIATGTSFAFKDVDATTTTSPTITLEAKLRSIDGLVNFTGEAFSDSGTSLGSVSFTRLNDTKVTLSSTQFIAGLGNQVRSVVVTATLGTLTDVLTIYRLNDGSEQITVELSNQAHTIPAFTDGTVAAESYAGSGTIIKVLQGSTYLAVDTSSPYQAGSWRVTTISGTGITPDPTPLVGASSIEFDQHQAMSADAAYIDYTITGVSTTGKSFEKVVRQSFSKSKAGVAGSGAPAVDITATAQVFVVDKLGTTVSPSSITFTATEQNIPNPQFTWFIDGVQQAATTSTFVLPSFSSDTKLVKVVVTSGSISVYDQITIFALREGSDALSVGLINENQTLSYDSANNPYSGQLPLSSQLVVARGATILTSGVTYSKVSESGITTSINATTGVISVTAMDPNVVIGEAVFKATVGTTELTKKLTINKSKDGRTPVKGVDYFDGINGTSVKVQYSTTSAGPWVDAPTASTLYIRTGTKTAIDSDYVWAAAVKFVPEKGVEYEDGDPGVSSYLHIKYSNDGGTTFTANNGETPGEWIGTYTDSNIADSTSVGSYTWAKIKGEVGQTGQTGQSNHRVYAKNTSNITPPTISTTTTSGAAPSGWSNTPVTLSTGEVQWQADGVTPAGSTTTTWGTPYLSYFKVGSLDAITANIGTFTSSDANGSTVITGPNITVRDSSNTIRVRLGRLS